LERSEGCYECWEDQQVQGRAKDLGFMQIQVLICECYDDYDNLAGSSAWEKFRKVLTTDHCDFGWHS
jgi:hypothetical protein